MPKIISRKEAREQGLTRYFTGKPCKNGHLEEKNTHTGICYGCSRANQRKYFKTDKGKEALKRASKSDALKKAQAKYRISDKGKEALRKGQKKYKQTEKGKISRKKTEQTTAFKESVKRYKKTEAGKKSNAQAQRIYYEKHPEKKISLRLRNYIREILKSSNTKKNLSSIELTGCTQDELVKHIEKQFLYEMNWENYGHGEGKWHVDHIVPINYFEKNYDFSNLDIQKIAFNYSNLQPMWGHENQSKGAKISKEKAEKKIAEIRKQIGADKRTDM